MQTASSRFWTQVVVSIFTVDNHYTNNASSVCKLSSFIKNNYLQWRIIIYMKPYYDLKK